MPAARTPGPAGAPANAPALMTDWEPQPEDGGPAEQASLTFSSEVLEEPMEESKEPERHWRGD